MDPAQLEFIEKYQILYQENPNSKVFAPLAEAYRKAGMLDEALDVCLRGVKLHPSFAGGRVALARVYLDKEQLKPARVELEKAVEAAPENILALSLLSETYVKLREPKRALEAYKMLLFLNPANEKATNAVKKLEALSADEFDDDAFKMQPIDKAVLNWELIDIKSSGNEVPGTEDQAPPRILERFISLVDAHLTRNDIDKALLALDEAERHLGPLPDVIKRRKMILSRSQATQPPIKPSSPTTPTRVEMAREEKAQFLNSLLDRIEERRHKEI